MYLWIAKFILIMELPTADSNVDALAKQKSNRIRSVAYPSHTLESSLKISSRVNNEFTALNYIPLESISKFLNTRGGTFLMQISSCVQYGLLQLKKGEGYKPTDLLGKIMKPLPSENVNDLLLECLCRPELYKKLFNDFKDKQLPSETGLVNILDRLYGVKGVGAVTAARIFFKNIHTAKLVSESNELKIGTYISFEEIINPDPLESYQDPLGKEQKTGIPLVTPIHNRDKEENGSNENKEIPIFLSGGREAKVILPKGFSDDDLKRISRVLSAYIE